jgi:hypothetical protein
MKSAFLFVLLGSVLVAQPASSPVNLSETLQAMTRVGASSAPLSAQLVNDMLSLAPKDRQPSRGAVAGFANAFTAALIGKNMTGIQQSALQRCIMEMLGGSGTNFKPAGDLRKTLASIGVGAAAIQSITTRFVDVGEEVRGPDDLPEKPPFPRPR